MDLRKSDYRPRTASHSLAAQPENKNLSQERRRTTPCYVVPFQSRAHSGRCCYQLDTESEQDNAGFNILRSRTQNGEFRKVNAKLIQGAGTTGERNEYTWTDSTAKPNTVYYYRIEDVSYAGVHKQLATVRLRGLVSATGKFTTSWADLKAQN